MLETFLQQLLDLWDVAIDDNDAVFSAQLTEPGFVVIQLNGENYEFSTSPVAIDDILTVLQH